jgi:hypothetical protein
MAHLRIDKATLDAMPKEELVVTPKIDRRSRWQGSHERALERSQKLRPE